MPLVYSLLLAFSLSSILPVPQSLTQGIISDITVPLNTILNWNINPQNIMIPCQVNLSSTSFQNMSSFFYSTNSPILKFILENSTSLTEYLVKEAKATSNKQMSLLVSFKLTENSSFSNLDLLIESRLSDVRSVSPYLLSNISCLILDWSSEKTCFSRMFTSSTPSNGELLKRRLQSKFNLRPPPIGIGYHFASMECTFVVDYLKQADIILVTIEFQYPANFPEAYGIFADFMNSIVKRNEEIVKISRRASENRKPPVVFRLIIFESWNATKCTQIEVSYHNLFYAYSTLWAKEYSQQVVLDYSTSKLGNNVQRPVTQVIPYFITQKFPVPYFRPNSKDNCSCDEFPLAKKISYVQSAFFNIFIDTFELRVWECFVFCLNSTHSKPDEPRGNKVNVTISLDWSNSFNNLENISKSLSRNIHAVSLQLTTVLLENTNPMNFHEDASKFRKEIRHFFQSHKNLRFGCISSFVDLKYISTRIDLQEFPCPNLINFVQVVVWKVEIYFDNAVLSGYSNEFYASSIQRNLQKLYEEKLKFSQKYPKVEMILSVETFMTRSIYEDQQESLFCNERLLKMNRYFEAIINWAQIRQWKLIIKRAFDAGNCWWNVLQVPDNLQVSQVDDTFFAAMRNYPETIQMPGNVKAEACIKWSQQPNKDGIKFLGRPTGVTVNLEMLKGGKLKATEIETIMDFAFHKFAKVEFSVEEMEDVFQYLKSVLDIGNDGIELFFEIQLSKKLLEKGSLSVVQHKLVELLEENASSKNISLGIHFANWEEFRSDFQNIFSFESIRSDFMIGAVVRNCTQQINNFYQNSKLPFPPHISYLICETSFGEPFTNEDKKKLAHFFEGHIILEKLLKKISPNLQQVHFKLQTSPETVQVGSRHETGKFLRFVNDLSQFSEAYNFTYFIPAFDNKDQHKGWWRVDNFTDLTDSAAYFENEAEYFNWTTWRPEKNRSSEVLSNDSNVPWGGIVIGLSTTSVLFVCAITILVIRQRRLTQLLSDDEVREFLEGRKKAIGNDKDDAYAFSHLGFKPEFEIAKKDLLIESDKILGMDNFGMVHKAIFQDAPVAVKSPLESCPKDSFKSMLSEVKVLCHVGHHQNVIRFVGAYTKEIRQGILYIVTELCSNGSLQSFLRKNKESYSEDLLNFYELLRFSCEIASGMEYISSKRVIHADLSTRNVLLNENFTCKIADFGLSRKLYEYEQYVKDSQEPLPWRWMSYESLARMEFTTKSDVWSFGVTLWEIFSLGDLPYPGLAWSSSFTDELKNGLRMDAPTHATPEIHNEMLKCWSIEAIQRPDFSEMYDFFAQIRGKEYYCLDDEQ